MIYLTGDIHGDERRITVFADSMNIKETDTVIILGDVGANYHGGKLDFEMKTHLNAIKAKVLCIHGNHERRPSTIPTYHETEWNGGTVWVEDDFPNLLFAKDGEIYTIEGYSFLVIGGAYSVDKFYRLRRGYGWWSDEQPSDIIKQYVEKQIQEKAFDIILSHTCPFKYEPTEAFLPQIDQSRVDNSTELWLDTIEEKVDYKDWYCGHWHIDKHIDKMHFLFESWEVIS